MRKTRVLLIEDDPPAREALSHLFRRHGCEVDHARTGEEGILLVEKAGPDVIVLDIKLAGAMDGYAFLERLKAKPDAWRTPVVIVTNYGLQHDVERGRISGAKEYLVKSDHSIHEIVDRVLRLTGAEGPHG
jgi:two-component system OmpR family response regulator